MHGDKLALDREWFIVCIACSAFSCDYYSWTLEIISRSIFLNGSPVKVVLGKSKYIEVEGSYYWS